MADQTDSEQRSTLNKNRFAAYDEWAPLVGVLILICGDIELLCLQLQWNLSFDLLRHEELKSLSLRSKATRLLRDVDELNVEAPLAKRVRHALNKTIGLADKRNLVAHNPLQMDVYLATRNEVVMDPHIRSLRGTDKHLSLEDLTNAVEEARAIAQELWDLVLRVGERVVN